MRQLLLIAALIAVALTRTRVTPNTKLSDSFDNLLANHQFPASLGQDLNAPRIQAFTFTSESIDTITQSLAEALPWIGQESLKQMYDHAPQVLLGDIQTHYVFKAFPTEAVFRYVVVNFYKDKAGSLTCIFAEQERKAFGIMYETIYHTVRTSEFGINLSEPIILVQTGENRQEFHEFNMFQILGQIKEIRASQKSLGFDIMAAMAGAQTAISGFANAYKDIAAAFKTTKSNTFKEKIAGTGFDYYSSKTRCLKGLGVPDSQWDRYVKAVGTLMELNKHPEIQANITALMELATFVPESDWIANDLTFDKAKDSRGECSTVVALTQKDYIEERANVVLAYITGSFALDKDMLIYTKFKSVAGGIYEETKDQVSYNTRSITEDEIKMVHATMMLSAIQTISEYLGVEIKLPALNVIINQA